jgi:hypothetical protein
MTEIKKDMLTCAIDFDGTCVTNENFPGVGKDIGAVPVLQKIVANGNRIILNTRRFGISLKNAEKWFKDNNIELYAVNKSPNNNTGSPKIDADIFIDDKALGAPLKFPKDKKPYINWILASALLRKMGAI